ncbi:MAG TPA: Yip1 family protein [Balneolaceae bacterium]|nr:Yip1 family protein [Balneolaceae bacterium]
MEPGSIFHRIFNILFSPQSEWYKIEVEQSTNREIIINYVFPLAAAAAIISLFVIWMRPSLFITLALKVAVLKLLVPIVVIIAAAVLINLLSSLFNSKKHLNRVLKLVSYSYTPVLLINIVTSISISLGWLNILDIYGIILFWTGLPVLLDVTRDKRLLFTLISAAIIIALMIFIPEIFRVRRLGYY